MIDLTQISRTILQTDPFNWAVVDNLFSIKDALALATSYPRDHFKTVAGYGGEKDYEYDARELIALNADAVSHPEELSKAWLNLAQDFLSPSYRIALSLLCGHDLTAAPLEVNVFHYGPGACLGPHPDLPDKLVTHVLYFNQSWNRADGGCLGILRSADGDNVAAEVLPIIGNSAVLVRSDNSWHKVSRVAVACNQSRRCLTATFYQPGSVSTMWPPGDTTPMHRYMAVDPKLAAGNQTNRWAHWRSRLGLGR